METASKYQLTANKSFQNARRDDFRTIMKSGSKFAERNNPPDASEFRSFSRCSGRLRHSMQVHGGHLGGTGFRGYFDLSVESRFRLARPDKAFVKVPYHRPIAG